MKRTGLIITIVLAVLAFVCGFGGVSAGLFLTQPAASAHVAVQFVVNQGDTATEVANNLQAAGLIRNATVFKVLAKVRKLVPQQGTYTLYPNMTMDQIIALLSTGAPVQQVSILIPPGLRVTQYPALFSQLPSFKSSDFLQIVKTGKFADGTTVNSQFWFVEPPRSSKVPDALEGYLTPDTYNFDATDDAKAVIVRLLDAFGENLCRGPDAAHADAYLSDQAQCKAHAATIGGKNIFTLLEQKFAEKDDRLALYDALTVASIVQREVSKSVPDIQGVTNVLYSRYLVWKGQYASAPQNSPTQLDADPTVQFARDSDHPPADGKSWWKPLQIPNGGSASSISPNSPYNTYVVQGLPLGPISAPEWVHHVPDAINVSTSKYFYYWASCQGNVNKVHYAATLNDFNAGLTQFPPTTC